MECDEKESITRYQAQMALCHNEKHGFEENSFSLVAAFEAAKLHMFITMRRIKYKTFRLWKGVQNGCIDRPVLAKPPKHVKTII